MRLHQITCGYVTADDGTIQEVDSNRMNELMSILRRNRRQSYYMGQLSI